MSRVPEVRGPDDPKVAVWSGWQPRIADAVVALSEAVYQNTGLSFRVAEAARMRVAQINGCILCRNFRLVSDLDNLMERAGAHSAANLGVSRGSVPDETFYVAIENWRDSDLFSAQERLAIEYAERIAEAPRELPLDDAFWQRLHAAFDDAEIVDLTYSITTWIATGRFTHVLGFDGSCDVTLSSGRAATAV